MTCVVAVEHASSVWIGADSAGVSGWSLTVRSDEKVFTNGPFVMGFTSSFRMGQLLRYNFTPPARVEDVDDARFMTSTFVDAVRACLKTGGFAKTTDGREEGGSFLVGYRGHIYEIGSDFQVGRPADPFAAVGCGADIALGALYAVAAKPPATRIQVALEAAERFSAGVRGPFTVIEGTP
jgi:ATP-dependent protease HslVU (ClpYQ) peptidase subunit